MDEATLVAPVSVEHAQRVVHERLPALPIVTIAYMGGGSFSTFVINDAVVFRFPKGGAHVGLDRRIALEAALCDRLRDSVHPHEVPLLTHTLLGPMRVSKVPFLGTTCFAGNKCLSGAVIQPRCPTSPPYLATSSLSCILVSSPRV